MEKERKIKVLSLVALIVAVLGLAVAFAALSQTLTINGTASVDAAQWDIHFENLSEAFLDGSATENSSPMLNKTSVDGINVTLTKPEDMVGYSLDVVNKGQINAEVSSVEISPICTSDSAVERCDWDNDGVVTQDDIDMVNNNISFVVMSNGWYMGESHAGDFALEKGEKLPAGKNLRLTILVAYGNVYFNDKGEFDVNLSTELPKRALTFENLSIKVNFVQTN